MLMLEPFRMRKHLRLFALSNGLETVAESLLEMSLIGGLPNRNLKLRQQEPL